MEFDTTTTAGAFLGVVGLGVAALIAAPVMSPRIVLMMVLPSMLVFGGLVFLIGLKHGEFRAAE